MTILCCRSYFSLSGWVHLATSSAGTGCLPHTCQHVPDRAGCMHQDFSTCQEQARESQCLPLETASSLNEYRAAARDPATRSQLEAGAESQKLHLSNNGPSALVSPSPCVTNAASRCHEHGSIAESPVGPLPWMAIRCHTRWKQKASPGSSPSTALHMCCDPSMRVLDQ